MNVLIIYLHYFHLNVVQRVYLVINKIQYQENLIRKTVSGMRPVPKVNVVKSDCNHAHKENSVGVYDFSTRGYKMGNGNTNLK